MLRYLGAAGVLALGGISAAGIFSRPISTQGPDPRQLQLLAARASAAETEAAPIFLVSPPRRSLTREAGDALPQVKIRKSPVVEAAKPVAPAPAHQVTATSSSAAANQVKQIALMGITHQGDESTAWLVDLSTQAREEAEVGDTAFGFGVKEVDAESVVLTQNGEEFTVRLGEKEIPVAAEPPSDATASLTASNSGGRIDRGGRGENRGWRNNFRASMGSGGSYSGYNANQGSSFNGGNSRRSGQRVGSGFAGGNLGGYSGGFSGGSGRGNRNQSFLLPSANPQEARRRGVRFIGDGTPLPQPAQIQNPQTQRRRGTASGPAFGAGNTGSQTSGNVRR